jgi:cysteine desulfurase
VDEVIGIDGRGAVDRTHRCFRTAAESPAERLGSHRADIVLAIGGACSENGVIQDLVSLFARVEDFRQRAHTDVTQLVGRLPFCFAYSMAKTAALSAHKLGGPKGVGALLVRDGLHPTPLLPGGGQEAGRRSGTENVVGIAGFGAAAEAAMRDLQAGVWGRVARLRDQLEARLESAAPDLIIVGRGAPRLPNTSCFALPGWAGETQVIQMDLAGFAVSAGSACSSGKVDRASRVLLAMGFDSVTASSALRVSLGPTTTEAEVMAFADAWIDRCRRRNSRAA